WQQLLVALLVAALVVLGVLVRCYDWSPALPYADEDPTTFCPAEVASLIPNSDVEMGQRDPFLRSLSALGLWDVAASSGGGRGQYSRLRTFEDGV
ncbi:unnamed protein product, partial [Polarella glacialis]